MSYEFCKSISKSFSRNHSLVKKIVIRQNHFNLHFRQKSFCSNILSFSKRLRKQIFPVTQSSANSTFQRETWANTSRSRTGARMSWRRWPRESNIKTIKGKFSPCHNMQCWKEIAERWVDCEHLLHWSTCLRFSYLRFSNYLHMKTI